MNWSLNKEDKWYQDYLDKTLSCEKLSENQRKTLEEFNKFKTNQDVTVNSRRVYLCILKNFALFTKKDFKDIVRKDIEDFLFSIKDLKNQTKQTRKVVLKNFFQWIYGMNHNRYPDVVDWIDTTLKADPKDFRGKQDLLTNEEIERLLNSCNNIRNRAILMMILEWGFRACSIKNISMKDVKENDGYLQVFVRGKGEISGWFTLFDSSNDLKAWLKIHEFKDKPDAPLFYGLGKWKGERLSTPSIYTMINQLGKKSGIKKNVFTHLLRHQALTRKGEHYTDQELKVIALWRSSTMTKRYIHKDYRDIDQKERRLRGLLPSEKTDDSVLQKCKTPLDMKSVMDKEKEREQFFKEYDEIMPLIKKMLEEKGYLK